VDCVLSLYVRTIVADGLLDRLKCRRRGIYSLAVVLWLMIWQRLQRGATMMAAVAYLAHGSARILLTDCKRVREDRISTAPGGYCQSIQNLPKQVTEQAMRNVIERLSQELSSCQPEVAAPVFVLDGSSLQLPHTRELARAYPPASNQQGATHWPILRIVLAHEVGSGMALHPQWGPMYGAQASSEQSLGVKVLEALPQGAVILADRNFGIFSVAWEATQLGHPVVVRLTKVRAWKLAGGAISQEGDQVVVWKPSRADRAQATAWSTAAEVVGRLVALRVGRGQSKQWLYLFTTLSISPRQLAKLYRQRWTIETDLRSLKRTVQLHRLGSKTADGVEKELMMALCAYNLVRAVMCLAARRAELPPRRLSFTQVLHIVNCYWARLLAAPTQQAHDALFQRVLDSAATCKLPQRRKHRSFPRAVWGRGGTFPTRKTI
jgi:hypothetical protein